MRIARTIHQFDIETVRHTPQCFNMQNKHFFLFVFCLLFRQIVKKNRIIFPYMFLKFLYPLSHRLLQAAQVESTNRTC